MTTPQYLLAKYIPDPRRMEPRNIGVVVVCPEGIRARFIAEHEDRPGEVDGRHIPPFVQSKSAYRQWVHYWTRHIEKALDPTNEATANPDALLAWLTRGNKVNYCLTPGGTVLESVAADGIDDLLDYLYATLVEEDEPKARPTLEQAVRRLLRETHAREVPHFREHLPVECIIADGVMQNIVFDYGLKNGKVYRLYERVPVRAQPKQMEPVNSAAWKFTSVQKAGLVDREQTAALVYVPREQLKEAPVREAMDVLGSVTRVVNVAEERTAREEFARLPELVSGAHE